MFWIYAFKSQIMYCLFNLFIILFWDFLWGCKPVIRLLEYVYINIFVCLWVVFFWKIAAYNRQKTYKLIRLSGKCSSLLY